MEIKIVNREKKELTIIVTDRMMARIVDLLYPSGDALGSKGYVALVNHISSESYCPKCGAHESDGCYCAMESK